MASLTQRELITSAAGSLLAYDELRSDLDVRKRVERDLTFIEAEELRRDLRKFVRGAWDQVEPKKFVPGWHIDAVCDHLAYVSFGDIRNLIINIPPRSSKSLIGAVLWPVWDWLIDAKVQFMAASYAQDLAIRDAVKSRRLIESAWFQQRYGHLFYLDPSDNRKHRYVNNKGGHRISVSVGGKTTGEGGDKLLIDDPHNMTEVYSDKIRHSVLSWWDNSMRSRLNDPTTGQKILIGQRSHDSDLFGHVLQTEPERWVVLMLPTEFDPKRKCVTYFNRKGVEPDLEHGTIFSDPRTIEGELLSPRRFGPEEVKAERKAMAERDYSAQHQQDPTSGGGLILKKKYWQQWCYPADYGGKDEKGRSLAGRAMPLPDFHTVISIYDTAFEEEQENDFSARTTWGLFNYSPSGMAKDEAVNAMILERWQDRVSFPDLKAEAIGHQNDWSPDYTLIEKKASGHSLIQEMRASGIRVRAVEPGSKDKVWRAHMVSHVLESGRIWYIPRNWAYDVINQCAKFPMGEHDDLVDTVVMLLAFIRRMGMIELPDDEREDTLKLFSETKRRLYG